MIFTSLLMPMPQRDAEQTPAGPSTSGQADGEEQQEQDFAAEMRAKAQAKRKAMTPESAPVRHRRCIVSHGHVLVCAQ